MEARFLYIGFYDLLADAAFQHQRATKSTESYEMNRYARASIVASALSVECSANCLLYSMKLHKKFREELDKLPALTKIDTFLKMHDIDASDRGRSEVQKVAEVIRARNDFVHTKVSTIRADVDPPEDRGEEWMVPMALSAELLPATGIPREAMFWSKENSLSALSAVAAFFKYLFVELMQVGQDDLQHLLQPKIQFGNAYALGMYDEFMHELKGVAEHGVDFSFLGIFKTVSATVKD